jgi:serine/threonine protein kinase
MVVVYSHRLPSDAYYSILYRDLKPDNIGFDIRGDVRLFDFGIAKELKPNDLVNAPDEYNCTGLTGSRVSDWIAYVHADHCIFVSGR